MMHNQKQYHVAGVMCVEVLNDIKVSLLFPFHMLTHIQTFLNSFGFKHFW